MVKRNSEGHQTEDSQLISGMSSHRGCRARRSALIGVLPALTRDEEEDSYRSESCKGHVRTFSLAGAAQLQAPALYYPLATCITIWIFQEQTYIHHGNEKTVVLY